MSRRAWGPPYGFTAIGLDKYGQRKYRFCPHLPRALSKTLFDADWANHYLDKIRSDPNLPTDQYIQHLRSLCLDKDYPLSSISTQKMLSLLLEKNNQNQMAFEYLMAWYMLNKHLGNFIQNIERLHDFGYLELPTHYEEAALIYAYRNKQAPPSERLQTKSSTASANRRL